MCVKYGSRTPPGVRELKLELRAPVVQSSRRTPPGVRELKHPDERRSIKRLRSHPSRGA